MVRLTNKVDGKGRAMLDKITYMNTQRNGFFGGCFIR
jgi:hypothetical protein